MKFFKKIKWFISYKNKVSVLMVKLPIFKLLSDKAFLKLRYRSIFKKKLDMENLKTFNEKLQWLKLYDRNPEYTKMVDKYQAKKYVSDKIGEKYIVPTLGVWDKVEDIDFDSLPNQFVLKCTHDCGGMIICKDKSTLNIKQARKKLKKCLKSVYYWKNREWPYKNVVPRIIAEKYMEDEKTGELRDYKFFAFNGVVTALFIATDRHGKNETKFDFFDENFTHLDCINGHPNAEITPEKPTRFEEMKILASKLSQGIPQVRVDFYEVNGEIYFGEMTFFHWSGFVPFEPEEWDYKLGEYIELPKKERLQ